MGRKSSIILACGISATASFGLSGQASAQNAPTGTLNPAFYGTTPNSVQINPTSSPTDGGGPGGPSNEVTASSTGDFTQLANVYAKVDTSTGHPILNMFIGGSINANDQGVSHYIVALQTQNTHGVASLADAANNNGVIINGTAYQGNNGSNSSLSGQASNVGLLNVSFDTGFQPNALVILDPNVGAYTGFTDLSGSGKTAAINQAYNGALEGTPIGTGAAGDPGFRGASTGEEFTLDLTNLGYTAGSGIEASIFTTNGGSDGRTNNQVLAPFSYVGSGPDGQVSDYDYTYIDSHEGSDAGRQFSGEGYPGNQYFTFDALPEPASCGLLAFGALPLLRRRSRKQSLKAI